MISAVEFVAVLIAGVAGHVCPMVGVTPADAMPLAIEGGRVLKYAVINATNVTFALELAYEAAPMACARMCGSEPMYGGVDGIAPGPR